MTNGSLADARLTLNVPLLDRMNTFSGTNTFNGSVLATNAANRFTGTFTGSGSGLTGLSVAQITTGVLGDTQLSTNVPLLNRTNTFSGTNTFSAGTTFNGSVSATNTANTFTGTFTGTGTGLTALDAAQLKTGTVSDDRLSAGIARTPAVAALEARIVALEARLTDLTSATGAPTLASVMYVSADPTDPGLIGRGLRAAASVPAPAWANGSTVGSPAGRSGHSGVWTGQEWILWGGILGRDFAGIDILANSGGRYQPDADAWAPISTVNPPARRARHTAVWTGSEMIIWGGYGGGAGATVYLKDGGRFSVANNLWSPLAASPLSKRDGHGAVWTGSRMLIWGGNRNGLRLADGALYNPADDTWTLLPTTGAPTPRANASVVWTGDRLLVWGGDGFDGYLADGAQLVFSGGSPATSWQPVSAVGAPTARSGHSTVWTGANLVVWGGENSQGLLGNGAAYNPVADVWTTLPTDLAPLARKLHAAVWTGTEMIVLGGATADGTATLGSAYDPNQNRWRALNNPGNPVARQAATAVWQGSQILIFGGLNNAGAPVAALQRLDPQPAWYFFRKP